MARNVKNIGFCPANEKCTPTLGVTGFRGERECKAYKAQLWELMTLFSGNINKDYFNLIIIEPSLPEGSCNLGITYDDTDEGSVVAYNWLISNLPLNWESWGKIWTKNHPARMPLGSAPRKEKESNSEKEAIAWCAQLWRFFNKEKGIHQHNKPDFFDLKVEYRDSEYVVVCYYSTSFPYDLDELIFWLQENEPRYWDDEAKKELNIDTA